MNSHIVGRCPMGCGDTLFVGTGGHITCSLIGCPRPTAVDELLQDGEAQHVVQIDEDVFTVRHPLRERLDDDLITCSLHAWIASQPGPPSAPGRYRVTWTGGNSSTWERQR